MNNKTYTSAKPFVKWVGGKTQLLEDIKDCFELIKEKCYGHYKYIPNAFKT